MNCWEFKKCCREKGGNKIKEFGICPAYPSNGQTCAYTAGTLCGGKIQGTFATKSATCLFCEFYKSDHFKKRK